jgi:peroxiredoxin Q/BCP|tara:strand:- start:275 stop:436 length:162 start_codon:yes stop_codon:yes gene_type:complete
VWGKKKLYGREYEGINRSTFVLDEESHVTHVFTKVSPKKHQEELLNALGLKST